MTPLQRLASDVLSQFATDTRNDGTKFRRLKDDHPEWMRDLCHDAHGEMFPDDWRYEFIHEVLGELAETEDPDDIIVEADIYTYELTRWLASRADRFGYCDEAMADAGNEVDGTIQLLQLGQAREKREVLDLVRQFLDDRIEELGNEADAAIDDDTP